ncbi:MAG: hypothetical protein ACLUN6_03900 [Holdemanella sp.]|uniref:hypothetical protein n=1 Tax=Holdemanella sp. TaxID=1971762 RepID=UPI003992D99B
MSAGCAIGIGNVWKFPYSRPDQNGGYFVLFYPAVPRHYGHPRDDDGAGRRPREPEERRSRLQSS